MIPLSKDTITKKDISSLMRWLKTNPRLSKGKVTEKLEEEWSKWLGVKYSVYVNSGSSANLAMAYALKCCQYNKNNKVIVPSVSWITTVAPFVQLGYEPILCECDKKTLGIDVEHLEKLCLIHKPSTLILVHILGVPCDMDRIQEICLRYNVNLIEDSCESVGSLYNSQKTGTFGLMSSFSLYVGHHWSSIEGGFISTNNKILYDVLKSIRSHGWNRDLDDEEKQKLREEFGVNEFRDLYTFYHFGFNIRSTDLQAFIGLEQLKKLDDMVDKRHKNLLQYDKLIKNDYWKLDISDSNVYISNFAYPIITDKIDKLVKMLNENGVENRPLVCGSMGRHPSWLKLKGSYEHLLFADTIHDHGLYLPNNHQLKKKEIKFICDIVNKAINGE